MIPVNVVIADLKSKYQEIEGESDRLHFFLKVAHYGKYILENDKAVAVLEPLYAEQKKALDPCKVAWDKFIKSWRVYGKDILKQAKKAGIKDDGPLSNDIATIQKRLEESKGKPIAESEISSYFIPYWNLVRRFNDLKKSNLLIPKHIVSKDGQMKIYPIYNLANEEWEKFKLSREISVWWAHYQICRLAVGVLKLKNLTKHFKSDDVVNSFYEYEFNELAKGNLDHSPVVLHESKYRIWVKRLHKYLLPRLHEVSKMKTTNDDSNVTLLSVLKEVKDQLKIDASKPINLESWYKRNDGLEYKLKRVLKRLVHDKVIDEFHRVKIKDQTKKGGYRYKWSLRPDKSFVKQNSSTVNLQTGQAKALKLPSNLHWEEIVIRFINGHEVIVKARNKTFQTNYELMGFSDKRNMLPNKQWLFLEQLSKTGGEISWRNPQANSKGKKQKQLLSDKLKNYFEIQNDPFYTYRTEKAYKIKLTLYPVLDYDKKDGFSESEDDNLGIKEYWKEQSPQVYDGEK